MIKMILAQLVLLATFSKANSGFPDIVSTMAGSGEFLFGLFYISGLIMLFAGVSQLKKLGNRTAFMNSDSGIMGSVVKMLIGAALIYFPSLLEVLNGTMFASAAVVDSSALSYGTMTTDYEAAIKPIVFIIQFIGMVAILRGFLILSKASGQGAQPGTISKGTVHIFGGFLAVNIVGTIKLVIATFGVSL